jgi:hypothetical protein
MARGEERRVPGHARGPVVRGAQLRQRIQRIPLVQLLEWHVVHLAAAAAVACV